VRGWSYDFPLNKETLASLDEAQDTVLSDKGDFVDPSHNAWVGPQQTSNRLIAFGFPKSVDDPRKKEDASDTVPVWLTEALTYNANGQRKVIPAGVPLFLRKGHFSESAPFGGNWGDMMKAYLITKDQTKYGTDQAQRTVLPPPLVREGERVQPDWLYRFLLDPTVIRPQGSVILRMPKFNMSPDESRALVNYFAAAARSNNAGAGITYPYVEIPQREAGYWPRVSAEYRAELGRIAGNKGILTDARRKELEEKAKDKDEDVAKAAKAQLAALEGLIASAKKQAKAAEADKGKGAKDDVYARNAFALVVNQNLCVKCHDLGDRTQVEGAQGPNLALAAERLRPEWVERWVAHPKRMFTYDPIMPPNFKNYDDPVQWQHPEDMAASPRRQVEAVRDLIMDRRRFAELLSTYTPPPPKKEDKKDDKKDKKGEK
jgi:hypothetical protein